MELNPDSRVASLCVVILLEAPAYLPSLYPHDRIVAGRVTDRTIEEFDSDGALFEAVVVSFKPVLDRVGQKLLAAFACLEKWTAENGFQFGKD